MKLDNIIMSIVGLFLLGFGYRRQKIIESRNW